MVNPTNSTADEAYLGGCLLGGLRRPTSISVPTTTMPTTNMSCMLPAVVNNNHAKNTTIAAPITNAIRLLKR